jgi:hypothetical protein
VPLSVGFWAAWVLPLLLLVGTYFVASRYVWRNAAPINVTPENARTPYLAGISVLAIAIPLVANLTFEVSKPTQKSWIVGILLAAMTFALVALLIGTILVYRFSLPSDSGDVRISSSLAPWMSIQYSAMVLFLIASFVGLVSFIIFARSDSTPPGQVSQRLITTKPLPALGSEESEILEAWGRVDARGKTWLSYRTADSIVVFCLEDAALKKVIVANAKEDPDAVGTGCSTHL